MNVNLTNLARYPAPLRIGAFLLILAVAWLPIAALVDWLIADANTVTLIVMPLLFLGFMVWVRRWGQILYGYPHPFRQYGLRNSRQNSLEWLQGVAIGLLSLLLLFAAEAALGWLRWQLPSPSLTNVVIEGGLVGLGVGFAEELLFRGWLLDELERDYVPAVALWINSLAFAVLHFIKPIGEILRTFPQFPGLLLLGLALVWGKRSCQGRLGIAIGLHGGLVWGYYILNVGQLIDYTQRVPEWVTGIDQNPLAGVAGLVCLGAIATVMAWRWRCRSTPSGSAP